MSRLFFLGLLLVPFSLCTNALAQDADKDSDLPAPKANVEDSAPGADEEAPAKAPASKKPASEDEGAIFDGDISYFTADLPEYVTIKVRSDRDVVNKSGETVKQTFYERQTVDPRAKKLSPEQRLGIFVAVTEKQIQENLAALEDADESGRKEIMGALKDLFKTRYSFDTAYQDFKASQIESKADKLRAEVDARKSAADSWVDAMVTLAKAKAEGIETMDFQSVAEPPYESPSVSVQSPSDLTQVR